MELVYLWIEEYRNIKRQGFNFSSEYDVNYSWKGDDWQNGKLEVTKNKHAIPNFFNTHNQKVTAKNLATISNITAIVGENGSGKSSLLDFLLENLDSYHIHQECENIAILWGQDSSHVLDSETPNHIGIVNNFNISAFYIWKINNELDLQAINQVTIFNKEQLSNYKELPNSIVFIYYSNIFDGKVTKNSDSTKLINISTNHLLRNDKHNSENKSLEQVTAFKSEETKRRLKFLIANENDRFTKLPFKLPKEIAMVISNKSGILKFREDLELILSEKKGAYYQILNEITPCLYSSGTETKEKKTNLFLWSLLFNILINQIADAQNLLNDLNGNIKQYLPRQSISKSKIIEICRSIKFDVEIKNLEKFIDFCLEAIAQDSPKIKLRGGTHLDTIYLDSNIENLTELQTALDDYTRFLEVNLDRTEYPYSILPFIYIDWTQTISTGESLYFNLFSRLYDAIYIKNVSTPRTQRSILNPELKKFLLTKKIILLFDEIETGYHPQWQKEFLKTLVEYLPEIFPSKDEKESFIQRSIQIILTSHSPFVVSDLPKENIIFLKKDKNGSCQVADGLHEMKDTFGANIHTLLSDSFFMKDGLMGDFAQKKINQLIDYLNNGINDTIKDDETAQKYINIIGEPIIKRQLQKMLDSKRLQKVDSVEDKVFQLEETIQLLQQEVNKLKQKS